MLATNSHILIPVPLRFCRYFSLTGRLESRKLDRIKDTYDKYVKLPKLHLSQQNVLKASEDYSVAKEGRRESVGGLIREQNRLRDIHAEMDILPSFHPTYPSLIQTELDAINNMHARLYDVHQHDRSDHQQYLQLRTALQQNFQTERESERRARGGLIAAVLTGLGCGVLIVYITSKITDYLSADHIGDSLIYLYASNNTKDKSEVLYTDWINSHHSKISAFLADISNELNIKKVQGNENVMVNVSGVNEMRERHKGIGEEMKIVTEALKRHSLPVLEVQKGHSGEKGLWITTVTYFCAAISLPILICCLH